MNPVDLAHYKEAVGHFPTGVAVVTGSTTDGPAGFTCQTFGSLSLEPTLVSFGANNSGKSWSRLRGVEVLGVSVLAQDQEVTARVFATRGIEKFSGVGWSAAPGGSPLIDGAIVHLEGRVLNVVTHGDHDLVVMSVEFAATHPGRPLVYYRGGYNCLA